MQHTSVKHTTLSELAFNYCLLNICSNMASGCDTVRLLRIAFFLLNTTKGKQQHPNINVINARTDRTHFKSQLPNDSMQKTVVLSFLSNRKTNVRLSVGNKVKLTLSIYFVSKPQKLMQNFEVCKTTFEEKSFNKYLSRLNYLMFYSLFFKVMLLILNNI